VNYEETLEVTKQVEETRQMKLHWGTSFEIPTREFRLEVEAYDGKKYVATDADHDQKPYLQFEKLQNGSVRVTALPPEGYQFE
jgi:hypothetical protein